MKLEPFEKETVITFNLAEDDAKVYTRQKIIASLLKKKGYKAEIVKDKGQFLSASFSIPKNKILFGKMREIKMRKVK